MFRAVLACLVTAGLCVSSAASDMTDAALMQSFRSVIFGAEYTARNTRSEMVKKYAGPIRVQIVNESRIDRREETLSFVRSLPRQIEGLALTIASGTRGANFIIYIVDRTQYRRIVEDRIFGRTLESVPGRCLVRVVFDRGRIRRSDVVIVADEGDHAFRRCLVEEVLQGLGPLADESGRMDSVFNDLSEVAEFTSHDRVILNLLYRKEIRPGMRWSAVERLLPRLLTEVRRGLAPPGDDDPR